MRPFIIATAFALFLTACSGAGDIEDSPGASDGGLTLSDFIPGAVEFDQTGDEEEYYRQQERVAQDKIAACMAEQGFEYVPFVRNEDQFGFSMPDTQEEFVAQYGFGIATMILENQPPHEEAIEAEMAKDPNNAIVEAMSQSELDAYYAALYGAEPVFDETFAEDSPAVTVAAFEPSGCQNTAYEEAFNQGAEMEFYEQFGPLMEDLYSGLESDPRIVELEGKWSSCMAEKGYDFADRNEAQVFLLRRLEEAGAITDLEIDPEGMGWGYGGGEEVEPGSPIEAAVKEIAAEEIAMAKVSLACSADEQEVFQEVYREAEQRFIQENLAELEQYKKENP